MSGLGPGRVKTIFGSFGRKIDSRSARLANERPTTPLISILLLREGVDFQSFHTAWVNTRPMGASPGRFAPGGEADEIRGKADVAARRSAFGDRAVVPATWSELRLLARSRHGGISCRMIGLGQEADSQASDGPRVCWQPAARL